MLVPQSFVRYSVVYVHQSQIVITDIHFRINLRSGISLRLVSILLSQHDYNSQFERMFPPNYVCKCKKKKNLHPTIL